jgi:pyruvate ferredoxin oxidoreductase gamma subunit/2-oxoisovalerate ferredoxin oxidoreductase gamma subunit
MAHAAHCKGYHVQVFPEFGVERRGVPVTAFARMDTKPIRLRTKITRPDHVMILDQAIARYLPVTAGLRDNGTVVMNATGPEVLEPFRDKFRPAWVDGTTIAARNKIGTATAPIVNTAMVGAFAAATGIYDIEHVREAITAIFPGRAEQNFTAALEAFREVVLLPSGVSEALEQAYEGGSR